MKNKLNIFSISLLILIASITLVEAHSFYSFACCSEADCHPIPCEGIIEQGKALLYKGFSFTEDMIKPSQDGQCHVCITNEFNKEYSPVPHCIYIQQGS